MNHQPLRLLCPGHDTRWAAPSWAICQLGLGSAAMSPPPPTGLQGGTGHKALRAGPGQAAVYRNGEHLFETAPGLFTLQSGERENKGLEGRDADR